MLFSARSPPTTPARVTAYASRPRAYWPPTCARALASARSRPFHSSLAPAEPLFPTASRIKHCVLSMLQYEVNGTPASQLSTPHSMKSPSPSPTSPGSLKKRKEKDKAGTETTA
ncbi:hypothetical protein MHYP_G00194010 [Metynnis hypsauchen]